MILRFPYPRPGNDELDSAAGDGLGLGGSGLDGELVGVVMTVLDGTRETKTRVVSPPLTKTVVLVVS